MTEENIKEAVNQEVLEAKAENTEAVNIEKYDIAEEYSEPEKASFTEKREKMKNYYQNLDGKEKVAWDKGWRPQEFFAGKNKDGSDRSFISAEEYLEKEKNVPSIAFERKQNEIEKKNKQIEKLEKQLEQVLKYNQAREDREVSTNLDSIQQEKEEAILDGDLDKVKTLEKRAQELQENKFKFQEEPQQPAPEVAPPPQPAQLNQSDQETLSNWLSVNQWYNKDAKMAAYANTYVEEVNREYPYMSFAEKLDQVKHEIESVFKINTPKASSVESGNNRSFGGQLGSAKNYQSLPADAKKACDRMVREGVLKNKQEYINAYYK
jgi:hypothetical protein